MSDQAIERVITIVGALAVMGAVLAILRSVLRRAPAERVSIAPSAPSAAPRTALEARAQLIAETPAGQCDVIDCQGEATHPVAIVQRVRGSLDWLIERLGGTAPARYRIAHETRPTKCLGHAQLSHAKCAVWITARSGRAAVSAEQEARELHEHNAVELFDALCSDQAAALAKAKRPAARRTNVVPLRAAEGGDTP